MLVDNFNQDSSFRLISVSFKEAALDSPSFRASINHLNSQIGNLHNWVRALSSAVTKIPRKIHELKAVMNSFTEHLVPSFADEGIIDQETTVPLLKDVLGINDELYRNCLDLLTTHPASIVHLQEKMAALIRKYKEVKHRFDLAQEKYDKYFEVYMSNSKVKLPNIAVEDAMQLYATKKTYLHESLNLVTVMDEISAKIDSEFLKVSREVWFDKIKKDEIGLLAKYREQTFKITRTEGWAEAYENAMKAFSKDVIVARNQVELSSIELFHPSTDLDDYNASLINQNTLSNIDEEAIEKHGNLLMKTWYKGSSTPVWVRRWAFIKSGVFGLLVLSPSKTFVQETDKIGLLLINTRYAAQEDRRFCFELRTSDQSITFQAESLVELKSWMKVFENERQRILSDPDDNTAVKIASSRFPPLVAEFASTVDTVVDQELTNTRIKDETGNIVSSTVLAQGIRQNEKKFQKYVYSRIPLIKPPLITSNTKSAIIAYSIAATTSIPTALTANTWGSINWGVYYIQRRFNTSGSYDTKPSKDDDAVNMRRSQYFESYPPSLLSMDIEMRSLFESELVDGEICLMSFTCLWSPNSTQELCGRVFITNHNVFLCNQALGFRSLYRSNIYRLTAIECVPNDKFDAVRLYFLNDSITFKSYLEHGELIKEKLQSVINNFTKESPESISKVISNLTKIEEDFHAKRKSEANNVTQVIPQEASVVPSLENHKAEYYQLDYKKEAPLCFSRKYPIPAKAVFHILFGDNSTILHDSDKLELLEIARKPWTLEKDGKLRKLYYCNISSGLSNRKKTLLTQLVVERMVDSKYYNVTVTKKRFNFYGVLTDTVLRFVIQAENADSCKVITYASSHQFTVRPWAFMVKFLAKRVFVAEVRNQDRRLKEAIKTIGPKGQVAKAIYLYGKLSQTPESEELPEVICRVGFRVLVYQTFIRPSGFILFSILKAIKRSFEIFCGYVKELTAQRLLIGTIIASVALNFFLVGRSSVSYWTVHKASNLADQLFNSDPMMLQRAVYLKDLQEITKFSVDDINVTSTENSQSFTRFKDISFVQNLDHPIDWEQEYFDQDTMNVAMSLRATFQEIGTKRHKLLIEYNILNHMEEEIAKGEYRNWLTSELRKCATVEKTTIEQAFSLEANSTEAELYERISHVKDYCSSCLSEFKSQNLI